MQQMMLMPIFILDQKSAFIMEQMQMLNAYVLVSGIFINNLTNLLNLIF